MIYVIETIEATAGNAEQLKEELLKLVPLSRREMGCISYQLFQEPDGIVA